MTAEELSEDMRFALRCFARGMSSVVRPRTVNALVRRDLVWHPNGYDSPELTEKGRKEAERCKRI
jgi:hypothetical protein